MSPPLCQLSYPAIVSLAVSPACHVSASIWRPTVFARDTSRHAVRLSRASQNSVVVIPRATFPRGLRRHRCRPIAGGGLGIRPSRRPVIVVSISCPRWIHGQRAWIAVPAAWLLALAKPAVVCIVRDPHTSTRCANTWDGLGSARRRTHGMYPTFARPQVSTAARRALQRSAEILKGRRIRAAMPCLTSLVTWGLV